MRISATAWSYICRMFRLVQSHEQSQHAIACGDRSFAPDMNQVKRMALLGAIHSSSNTIITHIVRSLAAHYQLGGGMAIARTWPARSSQLVWKSLTYLPTSFKSFPAFSHTFVPSNPVVLQVFSCVFFFLSPMNDVHRTRAKSIGTMLNSSLIMRKEVFNLKLMNSLISFLDAFSFGRSFLKVRCFHGKLGRLISSDFADTKN